MQDFQIQIYELLVRRGCPEAIAELIASRCDNEFQFDENFAIASICLYGFIWDSQPEGVRFWNDFEMALQAEEAVMYPKMED